MANKETVKQEEKIVEVEYTPEQKNAWIGKLYKFVDLLALNIGKAKEK